MKKIVSERQEGVRVGNLIVLAQPDQHSLNRSKDYYLARSYQVHETPHFVVCQKSSSTYTIVMHLFGQDEIDADLICFTEQELSALGLISSAQEYGGILFALLASPFPSPRDQRLIWRQFCLNTLARLRLLILDPLQRIPLSVSHVIPFATLYQRVFELFVGRSFLDVGCCFGFLPVLMAEHKPEIGIVGCDNNPEILNIAQDLASVTQAQQVQFIWQDVLTEHFCHQGLFDTVAAIHLLEHLSEQELPVALTHLLSVTSQRLLIAVPYEEEAQALYGHSQVFTQDKLHFWGKWCVDQLGGHGRYWCEEIMGGLLIVERCSK